ncbi:DUF6281 family protein [Streptomyces sp. M41]|uniref:DUF6281 family protein n=1 Tax=Streptomyces sp. M41 TaxID=3059412 RepID=UPI00374D8E76
MTTALPAGSRLLMASLLLATAVGCAEPGATGAAAEASCAYVVSYDSRTYQDVANVDFTVGGKLGTATVLACDDTPHDPGGSVPEQRITAYQIDGMDPSVAVAVGDTPAEARLVKVR